LDYLRKIKIDDWQFSDFEMLVSLLKPNQTPHSNAFLSFVKLPLLEKNITLPINTIKSNLSSKKCKTEEFLQRAKIKEHYEAIRFNSTLNQRKTLQKFWKDYVNLPIIKKRDSINSTKYIKANITNPLNLKYNSVYNEKFSPTIITANQVHLKTDAKLEEIREIYKEKKVLEKKKQKLINLNGS